MAFSLALLAGSMNFKYSVLKTVSEDTITINNWVVPPDLYDLVLDHCLLIVLMFFI